MAFYFLRHSTICVRSDINDSQIRKRKQKDKLYCSGKLQNGLDKKRVLSSHSIDIKGALALSVTIIAFLIGADTCTEWRKC